MSIQKAEYDDLEKISLLMQKVFKNKMQVHYSEEGQISFLKEIKLRSVQKRFLQGNIFYINEDMTAVLELEAPCHIAFLFVQKAQQGTGKSLLEKALDETEAEVCTVGSFSKSIGFYKRLGFECVSQESVFHGLSFTLMAKKVK